MFLLIIVLLTLTNSGNSETTKSPKDYSEEPSSPGTSWSSGRTSSSSQRTKTALLCVSIGAVCIVLVILIICAVYFACIADRDGQYLTDLNQFQCLDGYLDNASSNQDQGHQENQDLSSGPPEYNTVMTVSSLAGATRISLSHNECSQGPDVNGTTRNQPRSAHLDTLPTLSVHVKSKKSSESRTEEPPPSYSSLYKIEHL